MKYYIEFWKHCFDFKGKSSRVYFWYPMIINFCIMFFINLVVSFSPFVHDNIVLIIRATILPIIFLIPSLSLIVRRLRDEGLSIYIFYVFLLGYFLLYLIEKISSNVIFVMITFLFYIVVAVILSLPSKKKFDNLG